MRDTDNVRAALSSQYHAALAMLGECFEKCTDELWLSTEYTNACWQVGYHVLFFTHLYLQPADGDFMPWSQHQNDVQYSDGIPGPPDPESDLPLIPEPYSLEQIRAYWRFCDARVDGALEAMDLTSPESGFSWYPIPKLEHQLVNIRHIQHHTAQIADRLRSKLDVGIDWAGSGRRKPKEDS